MSDARTRIAVAAGIGIAVAAAATSSVARGASPASFADRARPVIAPVNADYEELGRELGVHSRERLPVIAATADRLRGDARHALVRARAFDLPAAHAASGRLLGFALTATVDYARKLHAAATKPTGRTLDALEQAADAARSAFAYLALDTPDLQLPAASAFSDDRVSAVLAARRAKAARAGTPKQQDERYVATIDRLLKDSAETRKVLGDVDAVLGGWQAGTLTSNASQELLTSIIGQRRGLRSAVAVLYVPKAFAASSKLLQTSLTRAIADAVALEQYQNALLAGNRSDRDRYWRMHQAALAKTARTKKDFVAAYNRERRQALRLGPLVVGTHY